MLLIKDNLILFIFHGGEVDIKKKYQIHRLGF